MECSVGAIVSIIALSDEESSIMMLFLKDFYGFSQNLMAGYLFGIAAVV
jgi:hypothetical protein